MVKLAAFMVLFFLLFSYFSILWLTRFVALLAVDNNFDSIFGSRHPQTALHRNGTLNLSKFRFWPRFNRCFGGVALGRRECDLVLVLGVFFGAMGV